ncbi:DUF4468 domain-containing protein [Psychroflexus aestuariivivens]|uniref:DUF4468 domain-containing protein n=1 Tax=Psychroflexus aestuariivivens TaxID=1795040 RepID=UPI000FD843BC|nr:DUF4468 domain-containing protein [Psychroflexus aestuariivivens]
MLSKWLVYLALVIVKATTPSTIPEFKLTSKGVEPIVIQLNNTSAKDMYAKTKDWIKETYYDPDEVIKAEFQNKKIRISGPAEKAYSYKVLGKNYTGGIDYELIVEFKKNRYRLSFIIDKNDMHLIKTNFFKKDGEMTKYGKQAIPDIEKTMNELSSSLYNYLSSNEIDQSDEW